MNWKLLAAKELIDGLKALAASANARLHLPCASNGWQLEGTNRATMLADAEANFSRARLFRARAA